MQEVRQSRNRDLDPGQPHGKSQEAEGLVESSILRGHGTFTPEAEAPGTLVTANLELQRPRKAGD